jgi:hypothetical protein
MLAEQILGITLKHPGNIPYICKNLDADNFLDKDLQNLYKMLIIYYTEDIENKIDDFDYKQFQSKLESKNLVDKADFLVLMAEKDFFDFDYDAIREELVLAVKLFQKEYYNFRLKNIESEMKIAEQNKDDEKLKILAEQFNQIVEQNSF